MKADNTEDYDRINGTIKLLRHRQLGRYELVVYREEYTKDYVLQVHTPEKGHFIMNCEFLPPVLMKYNLLIQGYNYHKEK